MKLRLLASAWTLGLVASTWAGDIVLFDGGADAAGRIVLPSAPSASQRYAAEEYAAYMRKMTGRDVTVVGADASDGRTKPGSVVLVTAEPSENLGEDGFTLRSRGDVLEIRGSRVRGCLYGVYELLERFGGCRWYASDFEVVPKLSRLAVPENLNVTERPAFAMRQAWWYDVKTNPLFAAKLRLNGFNATDVSVPEKIGGDTFRFGAGLENSHTLFKLLPYQKYFKEHPEYFALIDGERHGSSERHQLCLTNPDVLRIVTEEVLAAIRRDPGARFYGVSQNDGMGYCQCERCAAVDAEEGSPAGTMVRFVNAVAEAVEKEFPDVLVETLAYRYTRTPPKSARYRRNVVPCLCTIECDMAHPIATGSYRENVAFRDDIVKWGRQGRELYVWDYTTLFTSLPMICPNVQSIAPNLRFYRDNNVKELFMQGCGAGRSAHLDALKVWLMAKLMWNPDRDDAALVRDFTDGYYGAAAPFVREDIEEAYRLFGAGKVPLYCEDRMPLREMPDAFFAASRARLGKALAAVAGDEDLSYHVRELLFSLDFTELDRLRVTKKDEKTWTEPERNRAAVLARRLLAFLAVARHPVRLGYGSTNEKKKLTREWSRLAGAGMKREGLDPLVSLFLNSSTWLPGDETPVKTMKTLRRDYGLRRFMFDPPGLRHACGKRGDELYVRIGESFAAGAKALRGDDVVLGWFDRPTLAWNHHTKCQHVTDCDGNVSSALCPLDREGTDRHIANVKRTVEIGRPRIVIVEDDLNLSGHSGLVSPHGGCFCPLHMAAFAKRVGRTMTAKEAGALFDNPTAENAPLRQAFAQISKESLAQFCRRIRAAIDAVDPTIRVCLCQSAQVDIDGDTTEADVRALAGDTRPMTRIYGANYLTENVPESLPKTLAHTFYSMQHVPRDVEMIYEADSFPHTRFYNSSLFYVSEIAAAFMAGAEDLLLFCVRTAENPLADTAYLDIVKRYRARFAAVRDFRQRSSLVGVRAVYHANERAHFRVRAENMLPESARVLAKFGFPMTTLPSKATVLFGATAERTPVEDLREIFSGAVIVDSTAALALEKRGLGAWLGCSVKDGEKDLEFPRSRILPVAGSRVHGLNSYDYKLLIPATPVPGWDLKMNYVRITPGATSETWIRYEDVDGNEVAPSFVASKNALGGTVGVMSFSVKGNFREWLYSPEMQDVFRNFFDRATGGQMDVVSTRTPGVWLFAAVSDDDRELLVMANNLAGEPRPDIALEFSRKWRCGTVERLTADGTWQAVGTASDAFRVEGLSWPAMTPEFFKVTRREVARSPARCRDALRTARRVGSSRLVQSRR